MSKRYYRIVFQSGAGREDIDLVPPYKVYPRGPRSLTRTRKRISTFDDLRIGKVYTINLYNSRICYITWTRSRQSDG